MLAANGGALKEMLKPFQFFIATVFGNGNQYQSWIHIDDLCRMMIYVIEEKNSTGTYNAVAPNPVTNFELVKAIQKIKYPVSLLIHVPSFILKIILGELSSIIFFSQNVSSKKIEETGFRFRFSEISFALKSIFKK